MLLKNLLSVIFVTYEIKLGLCSVLIHIGLSLVMITV